MDTLESITWLRSVSTPTLIVCVPLENVRESPKEYKLSFQFRLTADPLFGRSGNP